MEVKAKGYKPAVHVFIKQKENKLITDLRSKVITIYYSINNITTYYQNSKVVTIGCANYNKHMLFISLLLAK